MVVVWIASEGKYSIRFWSKMQACLLPIIKNYGSLSSESFSAMQSTHCVYSGHLTLWGLENLLRNADSLITVNVRNKLSFVPDLGVSCLLPTCRKCVRQACKLINRVKYQMLHSSWQPGVSHWGSFIFYYFIYYLKLCRPYLLGCSYSTMLFCTETP